jgi:hypothetical protein
VTTFQATVVRRAGLDEAKARKVGDYCKKKFAADMTSAGRL